MKFEWELLHEMRDKGYFVFTNRAKVPGGWLVRNITGSVSEYATESMVFVPDPEHKWEIEKE